MNRLLGIENDKEISKVHCATDDEVGEYEEGIIAAPELDPMRPYLNSSRSNSWNNVLCDKFVDYFEEDGGYALTQDNKDLIEEMFHARLLRLGRVWRETHRFSPEELRKREIKSNQLARRNTRRVDVSLFWIPDILTLMLYPAVPRTTRNMPRELERP
jgi:hypothetical protein